MYLAKMGDQVLSESQISLDTESVYIYSVTAGMYCMSSYATAIGVRTNVIKVAVEDLAVNLGWPGNREEVRAEIQLSNEQIGQ